MPHWQACTDLHKVHATLIRCCSIASHVTDHTSAQSNKRGLAVKPQLQSTCVNLLQDLQRLVLLPIRQDDVLHSQAGFGALESLCTPAQQQGSCQRQCLEAPYATVAATDTEQSAQFWNRHRPGAGCYELCKALDW